MDAADYRKFVHAHGRAFRCKVRPVELSTEKGLHRYRCGGYEVGAGDTLPKGFIRLEVDEGAVLYSAAAQAKLGVVEIGRLHGGSTYLIADACKSLPVYSLDVKPQDDEALRRYMAKAGLGSNVTLAVGDSADGPPHELLEASPMMPSVPRLPHAAKYDVLFVDGDHDYERCYTDLERWGQPMPAGSHVLLHDCGWGAKPPVVEAVAHFLRNFPEWLPVRGPFLPYAPYSQERDWGGTMSHLWKRG